jgi:hypothetical protein
MHIKNNYKIYNFTRLYTVPILHKIIFKSIYILDYKKRMYYALWKMGCRLKYPLKI